MNRLFLALIGTVLWPVMAIAEGDPYKEQTKIAVLLALDVDFQNFLKDGKNSRQVNVGGVNVTLVEVAGKKIAVAKIGRGPAKAAISAMGCLLAGDNPWYLFSVTPAAGICGQQIGEIAVPKKIVDGDEKNKPYETDDEEIKSERLVVDGQLRSSDSFISSNETATAFSEEGSCFIDMNAYWVSEVAEMHDAKHVPIRVVSDDAGSDAGGQFREFDEKYKGEATDALLDIIANLPVPKRSILAHENILSEINAND